MLNVRLTPSTTTLIETEVPTASTEAPIATLLTIDDLGVCEECGCDLSALTGDNGEIRAVFCEPCEFGY